MAKATIALKNMVEDQIKKSIDLYRSSVNNTIYTAFAVYGCNNYTVGLKNGIILSLYDFDVDFIRFKIIADDKVLLKGTIQDLFEPHPIFSYDEKVCYNSRMNISELEIIQKKWELINGLISAENLIDF